MTVRPFLKWAGNKFRIRQEVIAQLPPGNRLIEPFAGSGAIFLNTNYPRYWLNDCNQDLINVYTHLQQLGHEFIAECQQLFNPKYNQAEQYYRLRAKFNLCQNPRDRACLFVYLNRHGYNGLCRYNRQGGYNVPFGRYKKPYFPADEMLYFHQKAKKVRFSCLDFSEVMPKARHGNVIYCDPPYVPLSESANFTQYHSSGFNLDKQLELAKLAKQLTYKGITSLISNHDTQFTRKAYHSAKLSNLSVRRTISCKGQNRRLVAEVLALFH